MFFNTDNNEENATMSRALLIRKRIDEYLEATKNVLLERDEVLRLIVLIVFSKENIFFYGPPGTGKSLIDNVMQVMFSELEHFRFLMREGAKYEDIFGEEIKVDNSISERIIEKKLPAAELAFIDEVWKGDDAVLNSLLTILNEKIFDDGYKTINVPLYSTVSASNEFPRTTYLAAIFERFLVRIEVPSIEKKESFEALLENNLVAIKKENIPSFTKDDIEYVQERISSVKVSKEYKDAFWAIKEKLMLMLNTSDEFEGIAYQISGRTLNKFGKLCRVSAILNGRDTVDISDLFLGKYVLWKNLKERKVVYSVIDKHFFKDRQNTLEELDILFKKIDDVLENIASTIFPKISYRVKITDDFDFMMVSQTVTEKINVLKSLVFEIENFNAFFQASNHYHKIIEDNIFLYAPNVIPWRAGEECIEIKQLNSSHDVIEVTKGGRYIDRLNELNNIIHNALGTSEAFLQENTDYFDYQHNSYGKF